MILKNISKRETTVYNSLKEKQLVKPGEEVTVSDTSGKGLLNNYSHLFRKVEEVKLGATELPKNIIVKEEKKPKPKKAKKEKAKKEE